MLNAEYNATQITVHCLVFRMSGAGEGETMRGGGKLPPRVPLSRRRDDERVGYALFQSNRFRLLSRLPRSPQQAVNQTVYSGRIGENESQLLGLWGFPDPDGGLVHLAGADLRWRPASSNTDRKEYLVPGGVGLLFEKRAACVDVYRTGRSIRDPDRDLELARPDSLVFPALHVQSRHVPLLPRSEGNLSLLVAGMRESTAPPYQGERTQNRQTPRLGAQAPVCWPLAESRAVC